MRLTLPLCLLVLSLSFAEPVNSAELRDLDTHCPFHPPATLSAWEGRAAELRLQLAVSQGIFPKPILDPVRPEIYGAKKADGYTIEKVVFESLPGFYVTGNLYRPENLASGSKVPGILCPHGHWTEARFYEASPQEVKAQLAQGAERFVHAAMNPIQARCVQLARMGCVVFHWDMIGYCDSQQISFERAHRFGKQEADAEVQEDGWLLFSPKAESHLQSVMGLQTLNSMRSVDMLLSLPEVDPERIAITGASGGGTQSFIAAALDPRIAVAFPAVMVSTGMQGGCTCENASLLRTGTGNVEIAGLIAPRPLGMTAADDWTRDMATDGFPELQKLYALYDAQPKVQLFPAVHFGHNYNHVSRTSMYGWMSQHLNLGFELPVLEKDFELTRSDELSVWDQAHPRPEGGVDFERRLMKLWSSIVEQQLLGMLRGDQQQATELVSILTNGWRVCLGLTTRDLAGLPLEDSLAADGAFALQAEPLGQWTLRHQPARQKADNSRFGSMPATGLQHDQYLLDQWQPVHNDLHVELVPKGSSSGESLLLYPALDGNTTTEKTDADGEYVYLKTVKQPLVANPRLAAGYTYGYNLPLFARRAQQLGLSLRWLQQEFPDHAIVLRASGSEAALAAAGLFCLQQIAPTAAEADIQLELKPEQFQFEAVVDIRDPDFLPGSAHYLGLPGLLAALQHTQINIAGTDDLLDLGRLHQLQGNRLGEPQMDSNP